MSALSFDEQNARIAKVFARLALRYGDAWLRKWEGLKPEHVREDWRRVLEHTSDNAIAHGFEVLRFEFPPTAHQFRELCASLPPEPMERLEAPKTSAEQRSENVRRLKAAFQRFGQGPADPLAWAKELERVDREQGGKFEDGRRMTVDQRASYRAALRRLPHVEHA